MADANLEYIVQGKNLQLLKQNMDKTYAKTVNTVPIDQANGNITLNSDNIPYGDDSNVKAALDAINDKLNYKPITISSLTNSVGTVEKGSKVRAVTVSWKFGGSAPVTATLNGTALTSAELTAGKKDFSYPAPTGDGSDPALVTDTQFTLSATDDHKTAVSGSTSVLFKNKKYWGIGAVDADAVDSAFILGLGGNAFADNFSGDFTVNPGADDYFYFAFPSAWGVPKFKVGGFEGGVALLKTLDFTNASGYTESYDVYRSSNKNLGQSTVTVG